MRVVLLAKTELIDKPDDYDWHDEGPEYPDAVSESDELAEIAGRLCYKSWDRPNPKTRTNEEYLANIINQSHFSVLEHSSASFWISGVSRSLTHELVRHRHLSFSQVSQRYVDESLSKAIIPDALSGDDILQHGLTRHMENSKDWYMGAVAELLLAGYSRKEARQAARAFLPNATETEIIVTGNMRSWREFVQKRSSLGADAEIRTLAEKLLAELKKVAPNTFQDL